MSNNDADPPRRSDDKIKVPLLVNGSKYVNYNVYEDTTVSDITQSYNENKEVPSKLYRAVNGRRKLLPLQLLASELVRSLSNGERVRVWSVYTITVKFTDKDGDEDRLHFTLNGDETLTRIHRAFPHHQNVFGEDVEFWFDAAPVDLMKPVSELIVKGSKMTLSARNPFFECDNVSKSSRSSESNDGARIAMYVFN